MSEEGARAAPPRTVVYYVPDVAFDPGERERRLAVMRPHVPAGCRLRFRAPPAGAALAEFDDDVTRTLESVRADLPTIDAATCDALLWGEALDALLAEVRPLARVPVVAPGAETLRLAAIVDRPTTIVVMHAADRTLAEAFVAAAPVRPPIASVRSLETPLRDLVGNLDGTARAVAALAREAVARDGARALYLGAMTLNTLGVGERLRDELGIPVYDPLRIGLRVVAEIAYALPGSPGAPAADGGGAGGDGGGGVHRMSIQRGPEWSENLLLVSRIHALPS